MVEDDPGGFLKKLLRLEAMITATIPTKPLYATHHGAFLDVDNFKTGYSLSIDGRGVPDSRSA